MRSVARLFVITFMFASASAAGCGTSAPSQKPPAVAGAAAPRAGSIFFWHATQEGKPGSLWLLGSVHVRGENAAPLDRAITDAATTCERGAFEIDFDSNDDAAVAEFVAREGMLHGKTLRDVVAPETYVAWSRAVEAHHLPRELHEKFQPWMAATMLQLGYLEGQGIRSDQGIDRLLYAFEKQEPTRKRSIRGLETALEQLTLLQKSLGPIQDLMLRASALGIEKKELEKLIALYAAGDEAGTERLIGDRSSSPELVPLMEAIFDKRNVSMTEKVRPMFDEPGCTVVTVGVGHLVGATGIVQLLRRAGVTVERVPARGPTEPSKMAYSVMPPKVFVSEEDAFDVRSRAKAVRREAAMPGAVGDKMRIYVFAERASTAITVYATELASVLPSEKRSQLLTEMVSGGLLEMKLVVGKPEAATVAGEPAIRVRGDHGTGAIEAGEGVAFVHGRRLYMITGVRVPGSSTKDAKAELDELVASFRLR